MNLTFINPWPELQPYVEAFWVFESPSGFPATGRNIVIPNGCAKLIISHQNSLISESHGTTKIGRAQNLYLVGNCSYLGKTDCEFRRPEAARLGAWHRRPTVQHPVGRLPIVVLNSNL